MNIRKTYLFSLLLSAAAVANAAGVATVTISGSQTMTFGADPNTAHSNPYSVTLTDADGNTIADRAEGLVVTWDIEGFKTANDTEGQYCDSYGSFSVNGEGKLATSFELRDVPMNFYGRLTATVNYGGSTAKGELYVVALGNKTAATGTLRPLAGYPADYSTYPDALMGYNLTKDTYGATTDVIVGGWALAGSDGASKAQLLSDADGTKYVRTSAGTAKKSHVLTTVMAAPTGQVIYTAKMRFPSAGATVTLTQRYPFWSSASGYANPVTVNYDGTNLTLNGTALGKDGAAVRIEKNTWYQVVLSADKSTEKCYCYVYDTNGTLLASSPLTAWADSSNPTYFGIGMQNSYASGSVDVATFEAYNPTIDADSYSLVADKTTLSIPNGESAVLTAAVSDTRGYDITQTATWTVLEADMQQSVIITPSATDTHTATLTLQPTAEAGTATVQVSIGGVTKTIALTLTSSAESVKFTQSAVGVTIPLDADATATETYAASVVSGTGDDLGRTVTLAAYEKDGITPLNNANITFDPQTGELSVTAAAQPAQVVITATGQNTDGETIAKSVTVNIHGMKFDFGLAADDALADGFTVVNAATTYNDQNGYGLVAGTPKEGGTASETDATKDYLEGAMTFNVKVQKGFFYTVNITYQGALTTGYVNSDLTGYELGTQTSLATAEYTLPATLDVIDLHLAADATGVARIAQISISKQPLRQKRNKPVVHHIGDSTSANNGSWAYRLASLAASGKYPELTELCDFNNNGAGGRNLSTYYTQGKLKSVLLDIYPDDIVMFGNNGTNGMGNSFEADVNYYLNAAETLGAKIIINSYTPHGAVSSYTSGYNSSTATFNSYRRDSYETVVRNIAKQREANDENYLGFVEIGQNADAIFNAYAADYAANGYASANAAAQTIIACFTDHNHYSNGTLACDLMLDGYATASAKGIVEQLIEVISGGTTAISSVEASQTGYSMQPSAFTLDPSAPVYTLTGQRIAQPGKTGIYIIGGKKVIRK